MNWNFTTIDGDLIHVQLTNKCNLKKEEKKEGYDNKTKSDPCPSKRKMKIKASETCIGEFFTCTKCGLLFSFQNLSLASLS